MKINIKKIKHPFCFWGVIKHNETGDVSPFQGLKTEIEEFYNNDQFYRPILSNSVKGKRCVVLDQSKGWQRAIVETVFIGHSGCRIKCFLVDDISSVCIMANRVYESPPWVWGVDVQGLKFGLGGLQPVSLVTDYINDQVFLGLNKLEWDSSAKAYFLKLLDACNMEVDAQNLRKDKWNQNWVQLTAKIQGEYVNINELLVKNKFAVVKSQEDKTLPPAKQTTQIPKLAKKAENSNRNQFKLNFSNNVKKEISECLESCLISDDENLLSQSRDDISSISARSKISTKRNQSSQLGLLSPVDNYKSQNTDTNLAECSEVIECSNLHKALSLKNTFVNSSESEIENELLHVKAKLQTTSKNTIKILKKSSGSNISKIESNSVEQTALKDPLEITKALSKVLGIKENCSALSNNEVVILTLENMLQKCRQEKTIDSLNSSINSDSEAGWMGKLQDTFNSKNTQNKITINNTEGSNDISSKKENKNSKPKKEETSTEPNFFFETRVRSTSSIKDKSSRIFVKGVEPPKPVALFCVAPFCAPIIDCLQDTLHFRDPTLIQAHVWPAILEGHDVLALTPSKGGKTLSYVLPLVSIIQKAPHLEESDIKGLNCMQMPFVSESNPRVVVLCSTWKKVQIVRDYFKLFFDALGYKDNSHKHQVLGICGGPAAEDARANDLVSGCSVLVCSPHSLLRICKANYINLSRLSNLVLDDIHILVEDFTSLIQDIMSLWVSTLNDPDRPSSCLIKPQVLGFGIQWTAGVKSFMNQYMSNRPLLYISHPLEAAVYGQVVNQIFLQNRSASFEILRSIIDFHKEDRKGGIAVFVRSLKTMNMLVNSLKVCSLECIAVHANMCNYEITQLQEQLDSEASSCPILVVLDSVIQTLQIDMIQVAIHYEFPKNKFDFGLRLSLMKYFYHIENTEDEIKPCSYMLFTEEDKDECLGLVKFLKRFRQPIPKNLTYLAQKYIESSEILKTKKLLCQYLQSFGFCRDIKACQQRHFISNLLDASNRDTKYVEIPVSGHIKILVKSVTDATHFYGLITKQRDTANNKAIPYKTQYKQICQEMNKYFSCLENCVKFTKKPKPDLLLATKIQDQFFRVKVVFTMSGYYEKEKALAWISPAGVRKVRVQGVDTGAFYAINFEKLYLLPQHLEEHQFQAIEFRIVGVKPIDGDNEWLEHANELVHKLIFEKEIEANITLSMGHTLWLNPVVIRKKIGSTGIHFTECNVVNKLLESGLAEKNDNHVERLKVLLYKESSTTNFYDQSSDDANENISVASSGDKIEKQNTKKGKTRKLMTPSTLSRSNVIKECNKVPLKTIKNLDPTLKIADDLDRNSDLSSQSTSNFDCSAITTKENNIDNCSSTSSTLTYCNNSVTSIEDKSLIQSVDSNFEDEKDVVVGLPEIDNQLDKSCYDQSKEEQVPSLLSESDESLSNSMIPTMPPKNFPDIDVDPSLKSDDLNFCSLPIILSSPDLSGKILPKSTVYSIPSTLDKTPAKFSSTKTTTNDKNNNTTSKEPFSSINQINQNDHQSGLIHGYCMQFIEENCEKKRMKLCEDVYISCSELPYEVTERDLKSLFQMWQSTSTLSEKKIIVGAFLNLGNASVPLCEFVDMKQVICDSFFLKNSICNLAITLCLVLAKRFSQDVLNELTQSFIILLNKYINEGKLVEAGFYNKILSIIDIFLSRKLELVKLVENLGLYTTLTKLEALDSSLKEVTSSLLIKLFDYHNDVEVAALEGESILQQTKMDDSKEMKQNKKYDSLNYDRFNCIDTDSCSSFRRPYTPQFTQFDTQTDVSDESDTDVECLPGI